jgi:hypothetical protein
VDEREWLTSTDLRTMLAFLKGTGRASDRKLRLFAVACCRRVLHLLTEERFQKLVELAERLADGRGVAEELRDARQALREEPRPWSRAWDMALQVACQDAWVAARRTADAAWEASAAAATVASNTRRDAAVAALAAKSASRQEQADLVRDIFGPLPFIKLQPIAASVLAWNGGLVVRLATAAYEGPLPCGQLEPVRLAVLADALEEAGTDDREILEHLRGPGRHVRGCCVIDAILERK